ncbi:hypothetical protein HXX76_012843 [Chlamydomonas incerta]|uniref:Uncharacterized protein n=1 Tax=Chlamydomonas incerta TaxID=51695 RepID=A0A835SGI4_CHLIN|nr:hypothetical protein HXX76_012843 [Chlamydomonas incerta]|eukprot:KAG2426788.1 hypothetical protein HXX76_012843 [Chlamydomonas incerta]
MSGANTAALQTTTLCSQTQGNPSTPSSTIVAMFATPVYPLSVAILIMTCQQGYVQTGLELRLANGSYVATACTADPCTNATTCLGNQTYWYTCGLTGAAFSQQYVAGMRVVLSTNAVGQNVWKVIDAFSMTGYAGSTEPSTTVASAAQPRPTKPRAVKPSAAVTPTAQLTKPVTTVTSPTEPGASLPCSVSCTTQPGTALSTPALTRTAVAPATVTRAA